MADDPISRMVARIGVVGVVHGPGKAAAYRPDQDADYYPGDDAPPGGIKLKGLWEGPQLLDGVATGIFVVSLADLPAGGQPNVARITIAGIDYSVSKANPRFWQGAQNGIEFVLASG